VGDGESVGGGTGRLFSVRGSDSGEGRGGEGVGKEKPASIGRIPHFGAKKRGAKFGVGCLGAREKGGKVREGEQNHGVSWGGETVTGEGDVRWAGD